MRYLLQLFISMVLYKGAFAQEVKPDMIFRIDQTEVEAKVVEVTDSVVYYRYFKQLNGPIYSLGREEIIRIEYAGGYVELYSSEQELPLEESKKKRQKGAAKSKHNVITGANRKVSERLSIQVHKEENYADKDKVVAVDAQGVAIVADTLQKPVLQNHDGAKKRISYMPRAILSLSAGASRMFTGTFKEQVPIDYSEGYGGQIRFQYNVSDELGLKLSSGYMQWSRKDSINPAQTMTSTLMVVPVMLGAKYYFNKVVYMAGEAGISAQKSWFKTFDNETEDNNWQTLTSDYVLQPSAAVSLGAEVKITRLVVDVSPFLQWMYTEASEFGAYFAGVRVGIGLAMGSRKN